MTRRIAILLALASTLIGTCLAGVAGAAPTVVETVHRNEFYGRLTIFRLEVSDTSHLLFYGSGNHEAENHHFASRFELKLLARYATGHSDLAAQPCPADFHFRPQSGPEASWVAPEPVPAVFYGHGHLPQYQEIFLHGAPGEAHAMRLCWYLNVPRQYERWLALETLIRF